MMPEKMLKKKLPSVAPSDFPGLVAASQSQHKLQSRGKGFQQPSLHAATSHELEEEGKERSLEVPSGLTQPAQELTSWRTRREERWTHLCA